MATTKKEEFQEKVKLVKIKLPRQLNKGKGRHITVNNYDVFIPYGVEVEVPEFIVEVIQNNARQDEETFAKIEALEGQAQDN